MNLLKKNDMREVTGGSLLKDVYEICEEAGKVYYDKVHEELFMPDKYDTDWLIFIT